MEQLVPFMRRQPLRLVPVLSLAIASAILAAEPLGWLIRTWNDVSVEGGGAFHAAVLAGLLAWSCSSALATNEAPRRRLAVGLLLLACAVRLTGQVLAVNVVGGIALALDVYAIATLLRVSERRRALSPFWLAVLFLFTLPVERIVQRIVGFPLQELSAQGAFHVLSLLFGDVRLEGVRLQVEGRDVLVDLPCSGTTGLMIALAVVTVANALARDGWVRSCLWVGATLLFSIAGNFVRIALLATGLVFEDSTGLDVMAEPLHGLLGLFTLALSLLPMLLLRCAREPQPPRAASPPTAPRPDGLASRGAAFGALALVPLALVIVNLPRQPIDTSLALAPLRLPATLETHSRLEAPLAPVEERYFRTFGGQARKASYGPLGLTVVHTTSPLRHLHAPSDCLRGLGYAVRFLGTSFSGAPSAHYRAVGSDGDAWHVAVSFVSDRGHVTSNVAEAIWHWLLAPSSRWMSLQRVTPWQLPDEDRRTLEAAALAALDIPTTPEPPQMLGERP